MARTFPKPWAWEEERQGLGHAAPNHDGSRVAKSPSEVPQRRAFPEKKSRDQSPHSDHSEPAITPRRQHRRDAWADPYDTGEAWQDRRQPPVVRFVSRAQRHGSTQGPRVEAQEGRLFEELRVQSVCDPNAPNDVTSHLELPISANIDDELETFERLRRIGDMRAAREYFHQNLQGYMSDDSYVVVKYAEMLLDMGDYKAVSELVPHRDLEFFFPAADINTSKIPRYSRVYEACELLAWRWRLLKALASIYTGDASLASVYQYVSTAMDNFHFGPRLGHLELQVAVLVFRISAFFCCDYSVSCPLSDKVRAWIRWDGLLDNLIDEGREWDLRDLFVSAESLFQRQKEPGSISFEAYGLGAIATHPQSSETTLVAALDLIMGLTLQGERLTPYSPYRLPKENSPLTTALAQRITKDHPEAMRSRAFLRWLLVEAICEVYASGEKAKRRSLASFMLDGYKGQPGTTVFGFGEGFPLPIYVPAGTEFPLWEPLPIPPTKSATIHLVLDMAKEMDDVPTQILAYKFLALREPDPSLMLWAIQNLQSRQGNRREQMETLACRYIGCNDKDSRRRLLAQLTALQDGEEGPMVEVEPGLSHAVHRIRASLSRCLGVDSQPKPQQYPPNQSDPRYRSHPNFSTVPEPSVHYVVESRTLRSPASNADRDHVNPRYGHYQHPISERSPPSPPRGPKQVSYKRSPVINFDDLHYPNLPDEGPWRRHRYKEPTVRPGTTSPILFEAPAPKTKAAPDQLREEAVSVRDVVESDQARSSASGLNRKHSKSFPDPERRQQPSIRGQESYAPSHGMLRHFQPLSNHRVDDAEAWSTVVGVREKGDDEADVQLDEAKSRDKGKRVLARRYSYSTILPTTSHQAPSPKLCGKQGLSGSPCTKIQGSPHPPGNRHGRSTPNQEHAADDEEERVGEVEHGSEVIAEDVSGNGFEGGIGDNLDEDSDSGGVSLAGGGPRLIYAGGQKAPGNISEDLV